MSVEHFNQVIGRAILDPAFRQQLLADPSSALSGFDLTPDEHQRLSQIDPNELGGKVDMYFNPKELTVDKSVPWQHHKNVEGDQPELEFSAGQPKSLNAELMFDQFEDQKPHPKSNSTGPVLAHEIISPRDAASGLPTGKRMHKPILIVGSGILVTLLLAGGVLFGGSILPHVTDLTTATPPITVPADEVTPDIVAVTESVPAIPVSLACGQVCSPNSSCGEGLTCGSSASGALVCSRNGHCGCGVPCDPNSTNACDPGLKCVVQGGQSMCWAGGCEPTSTPSCQVIAGDSVCSACENQQNDPQDCTPDTGGTNGGGGGDGGGGGNVCRCRCQQVCNAQGICRKVCTDCNGKSCTK